MPLDQNARPQSNRLSDLNRQLEGLPTGVMFDRLAGHSQLGRLALASSFGAEAAVILHLASRSNPDLPILFIDTELLFPETLTYQRDLAAALGLTNVITIRAEREVLFKRDPENLLHIYDPDACCALRKTEPLEKALARFDSWISGRKRFHGGQRHQLPLLELDHADRIKINPLYNWSADDVASYFNRHMLPKHPLIQRQYASIGCQPCTRPLKAGETARSGRWAGSDKTECGIHFRTKGAA